MNYAKIIGAAYVIYSITTDIAIWIGGLYYWWNGGFQPSPPNENHSHPGCSTWNTPGLALLQILARGRQCESEVSIRMVLPAPVYVQSRPMSSLFCGCGQNFFKNMQSLCQTPCPPWQYTRKARDCQELFAAFVQIVFKSEAPIIVQQRSYCQVLFAQLHKINRLTSLCGCAILYQIEANLGKSMANLRKFWKIWSK